MTFPREAVKQAIYELIIDGDDGVLMRVNGLRNDMLTSAIAAKSGKAEDGLAKPILGAFFTQESLVLMSLERSLSTSMGWRLDKILAMIAKEEYASAYGGKGEYVTVKGKLPGETIQLIDKIINEMKTPDPGKKQLVKALEDKGHKVNINHYSRRELIELCERKEATIPPGRRRPNNEAEIELIRHSINQHETSTSLEEIGIRVDVFIVDDIEGVNYCAESKTIKPDKGQLINEKRDHLKLIALSMMKGTTYVTTNGEDLDVRGNEIKPILGTYYEAWGPLVESNFPTIDTFFEKGTQFLSGKWLWELVGKSEDTYEVFMSLLWEIHCDRKKDLEKMIGSTFSKDVSNIGYLILTSKNGGQLVWIKLTEEGLPVVVNGNGKDNNQSFEIEKTEQFVRITASADQVWVDINPLKLSSEKVKQSLRKQIQDKKLIIDGYSPLLYTHQDAIVRKIVQCLHACHSPVK